MRVTVRFTVMVRFGVRDRVMVSVYLGRHKNIQTCCAFVLNSWPRMCVNIEDGVHRKCGIVDIRLAV
jgi:hypothetical protein